VTFPVNALSHVLGRAVSSSLPDSAAMSPGFRLLLAISVKVFDYVLIDCSGHHGLILLFRMNSVPKYRRCYAIINTT